MRSAYVNRLPPCDGPFFIAERLHHYGHCEVIRLEGLLRRLSAGLLPLHDAPCLSCLFQTCGHSRALWLLARRIPQALTGGKFHKGYARDEESRQQTQDAGKPPKIQMFFNVHADAIVANVADTMRWTGLQVWGVTLPTHASVDAGWRLHWPH